MSKECNTARNVVEISGIIQIVIIMIMENLK